MSAALVEIDAMKPLCRTAELRGRNRLVSPPWNWPTVVIASVAGSILSSGQLLAAYGASWSISHSVPPFVASMLTTLPGQGIGGPLAAKVCGENCSNVEV